LESLVLLMEEQSFVDARTRGGFFGGLVGERVHGFFPRGSHRIMLDYFGQIISKKLFAVTKLLRRILFAEIIDVLVEGVVLERVQCRDGGRAKEKPEGKNWQW